MTVPAQLIVKVLIFMIGEAITMTTDHRSRIKNIRKNV